MESRYLQERRAKMLGSKPKEEKAYPKHIARFSKKREKKQKVYVKKVKAQVEKDDRCKIKSPVCTGTMQGFDHPQKRSEKNLLIDENNIPSCNACNGFKESNPVWARNNGFDISRFAKEPFKIKKT